MIKISKNSFLLGSLILFFSSCNLLEKNEDNSADWLTDSSFGVDARVDAKLVDYYKVWESNNHNAFTDLKVFDEEFFLTFREGSTHNSYDGAIRLIQSKDGIIWEEIGYKYIEGYDLRDPKLSITSDNLILLYSVGRSKNSNEEVFRKSFIWIYDHKNQDWIDFYSPFFENDSKYWLWNLAWRGDEVYSVGYWTGYERWLSLFKMDYGKSGLKRKFNKEGEILSKNAIIDKAQKVGSPGETDMLFLNDQEMITLTRRTGNGPRTALLGYSQYPFKDWNWRDLQIIIGGGKFYRLPDNRIVIGSRRYEKESLNGSKWTSLSWLDPLNLEVTEFLRLPSGLDNGYPGIEFSTNYLWVSYYSSHENNISSIYLAKIKLL